MGFQLEHIKTKKTISQVQTAAEKTSFLKKEIVLFSKPFGNTIKEDFYTELGVLLKAGVTLKDSLDLLQKSMKKKENQDIMALMTTAILSGHSLSADIKQQKWFSEYEYYSLKIGEETGTLGRVTEQLGDFFARKNEQRRNLVSALTYPAIIMITAVLVLVFMLKFVVPMFQDMYKQHQVELPLITRAIIAASEFMEKYALLMLVILAMLIAAKILLNKKVWFKKAKDIFIYKTPILGRFFKTVYLSQFTQAVSLLTASKVPVVNSIQLVKQMIDFYPLKNALESVEAQILKGNSLSESMSQHELFEDKMIALVKVAEETNQTEFIFERLNQQYNSKVAQQSKKLSTLLEPFIVLFVGVLVGVIIVAMYLPMFKLSSVIG